MNGWRWLLEAVEFANSNQGDLLAVPVAVFSVHVMNAGDDERSRRKRTAYLDDVRASFGPWMRHSFSGLVLTRRRMPG